MCQSQGHMSKKACLCIMVKGGLPLTKMPKACSVAFPAPKAGNLEMTINVRAGSKLEMYIKGNLKKLFR